MIKGKRNAIAMIMAIAVIVIIGTIMALSMALTLKTGKRTVETYLHEQVEILADSAREYAMYKIGTTSCVNHDYNITQQDNFYDIEIRVKYITTIACTDTTLNFTTDYDTDLQHDSAVIDIVVSVDNNQTNTAEEIRFYKRYIENINP